MGNNQCLCGDVQKESQEKSSKKKGNQKYEKNIPSRGSSHYKEHSFANRTTSAYNKERTTFRSISIEDFEIIKSIGRGAFGKVLLVRDKKTDQIYAMKTIIKENIGDTDKNYNLQERQILTHMESEFIIKLYFAFQDPFKLYMVLDFMDCGDLFRHLQRRGRFSEAEVQYIMCEVILGLEHLHKKGIVYRDLKPHNILIQADGHIKLADFGISKIEYSEDDKAQTFCGTYQYMAPEIYKGKGYGQQADWYSFGITMYELLTGKTPFDDSQHLDQEQQKEIKQRGVPIQEDFSSELQFLIQQLINPNPESRLGKAKIIKQDPYFVNVDWQNIMQKKTQPVYQPQNNMEGSQLQIDSLEVSDDLEDVRDTLCQEEGYFANFSFNHELKHLYDQELENDSDSDQYENQSKFKFVSRRETLVQTFQQPSLYKQTELRRQDSNNLTDSQQIRKKNISHNSSNGQNSFINNNNQSMMSNSNNSQKIKLLKQNNQSSLKASNKKKNTGSFSSINQVTLIPNLPYEESRRQYSVEFRQDQFLMYQSYQENDNTSQLIKLQKKQSCDNTDLNQNKQQKLKKYSDQVNDDIPEVYRQSEETADQ